jgi:N-acetylneuraminic acid mutarotase
MTALPTPPAYPFWATEAQGVVVNNKLYVFGGYGTGGVPPGTTAFTPSRRFYVYDPINGPQQWVRLPDLVQGVTHSGSTTDGRYIYWAGGYREGTDSNGNPSSQIFGSRAARWFDTSTTLSGTLPLLPVPRAAGGLALLGNTLHYIGGTNIERTVDVGDHYVLDLGNQAAGWTSAAPLPNPRHHAGMVALNGSIYYIGGQHGHDGQLVPQRDVHRYDPATDSWTRLADLPIAPGLNHISHSTIALDGRILIFGGQTTHDTAVNTVFAYDPATNAWSQLNPLPAARYSGVAGAINGVIYYTTGGSQTTHKGIPVAP